MYNLEELYQSDLPKRAILVYMYLSDRAGREGQCFPSIPTIARHTKLAQNTVRRAVKDLEKGGYLLVTDRQRPNARRRTTDSCDNGIGYSGGGSYNRHI